ncbi:YqiA/YcfP family alpha/beta fold hydrolase [Prochlorothrix hollandica]|uniref:Esterase n=1 Tax=Prochlorothrix hollandica PCC 9006 = CALU 1027 TaxID=317619 RepID=A0A0M2PYX8_PROHO|nr:YqiA/YcfP family alpha/beta fold hydrolase [Prochlorothrix hollandica]KKJ00283.1 esterase [Prochlorothrix hollandica PCC 9006 = CALU 1027]
MTAYFYLHGFASSPRSAKAKYFRDRFRSRGLTLQIPDLNQGDFSHLTLTRQIQQVEQLLPPDEPAVLLGSSLGGLTAAWVAQRQPQVIQVVLLAPAFDFRTHWRRQLGETALAQWHTTGWRSQFHYGEGQFVPLHSEFWRDCGHYETAGLGRSLPTYIAHGRYDDTIPPQASEEFARSRPWVHLDLLDSDHSLGNQVFQIWQAIQVFCDLPPAPLGAQSLPD